MRAKNKGVGLVPFYSGLFRESLLAALVSDPAVKPDFRALSSDDQERIAAEVEAQARRLGAAFAEYLDSAGFDASKTSHERLKGMVRDFLVNESRRPMNDRPEV